MNQDFKCVIARMKQAGDLKNDSAVARALGISPQAISNYKSGGRFPAGHIVRFAEKYGISIDWLLDTPEHNGAIAEEGELVGESCNIAPLSLEQSIYAGRLILVLNAPESAIGEAAKHCINALLETAQTEDSEVREMRMERAG